MNVRSLLIVCVFVVEVFSEKCITSDNEQGDCVLLNSSTVLDATKDDTALEEFIKNSICGGFLFFPKDNDISKRITEFPWLAQIKHRFRKTGLDDFGCSGSLINNRYVLTTATCLVHPTIIPIGVRLGEYHTTNEKDCVRKSEFDEDCSGGVEDFGIDTITTHFGFKGSYEDDVGLIRLNRTVYYSDYIRPICLPSPSTKLAKIGDTLLMSGWRQTWTEPTIQPKKKILSRLITNEECEVALSVKLNENLMCTIRLDNNTDIYSTGDSGGPVMTEIRSQWYQVGIVVDSAEQYGKIKYPSIHAKVQKYVQWIEKNL